MTRSARPLAGAIYAITLATAVAGSVFTIATPAGVIDPAEIWGIRGVGFFYALGAGTIGWLVSTRKPENPVGWLFTAIGVFAGVGALAEGYVYYSDYGKSSPLPGADVFAWFSAWFWIVPFALFAFVFMLFPTGRLLSARWRILAWILGVAASGAVFLTAFLPGPLETAAAARQNPFPLRFLEGVSPDTAGIAMMPLTLCMLASAVGVVLRGRRSRDDERAQVKWLAFAGVFLPITLIVYVIYSTAAGPDGGPMRDFIETLNVIATLSIPVAAGAAILKFRLYDIDVLINRTLVYSALTGALGIAYFGSVLVIGRLIAPLTQESDVAVAGATLAVFALFRPLRSRVQNVIDRRFYRAKYDAEQALERLESSLKEEVELRVLEEQATGLVTETLHPSMAELTSVDPGDPLAAYLADVRSVVRTDVELGSSALERFRQAGASLLVPLVTRGDLVGVLAVGEPLSGRDYSVDDRRFLARLGAITAPALRVGQLVLEQEDAARDKERGEQEMRIAQLIQQQFLPSELPARAGWHLAAFYRPAREVGGDFYDFIELPDGRVMIVAGDVTDKGVPAALVMASTRSILRGEAMRVSSPAELLTYANGQLCRDTPDAMFVTCICVVFDPRTGSLVIANAGHNLPYVNRDNDVIEFRATGMPLGLIPTSRYEDVEAVMLPGDRMLICSDGLIEAHDPAGELFGFDRTKATLGTLASGRGAEEAIDHMMKELDRFTTSGWVQEDDITMVTVEYARTAARAFETNGERSLVSEGRTLASFSIGSTPGNEREVMDRVAEAVATLDLPKERFDALKTAVAEAAMNAIEHGNGGRSDVLVDVVVTTTQGSVQVGITDRGGGQGDVAVETPDLLAKLEGKQKPRGWGLFLIRNLVDEMREEEDGDLHRVELTMHLTPLADR